MQRRRKHDVPVRIEIIAHVLIAVCSVGLVYVSLQIATREEAYQVRVHPPHNITKEKTTALTAASGS